MTADAAHARSAGLRRRLPYLAASATLARNPSRLAQCQPRKNAAEERAGEKMFHAVAGNDVARDDVNLVVETLAHGHDHAQRHRGH